MSIPSFEKSFASQEKSKFWSKKNEKQPIDCYKSSGLKYLFDCECGHEFEGLLSDITRGRWCGYCSNPPKKLCDKEDCETCLKKSFASNDKHIFWSSKNGNIQPRDVFKSSDKKCLFDCICGHEFVIQLSQITNKNQWCGYCSNPSNKLCDKEDCEMCYEKSFASHKKSKYWSSKNGNIQPRDVFKSSNSKYIFICENNHEYKSQLNDVSAGYWCPQCVNKTETKLYENMVKIFPSLITQYKTDWCKNENNNYLPFDFCIPEHNIIIEMDGRQHFIQVSNWQPPEITFENDKYKEKCANDNGYSTIRIIQEDVLYDKYDWCKELCEAIENIRNGNEIVNIYLCKNNEYEKYL